MLLEYSSPKKYAIKEALNDITRNQMLSNFRWRRKK